MKTHYKACVSAANLNLLSVLSVKMTPQGAVVTSDLKSRDEAADQYVDSVCFAYQTGEGKKSEALVASTAQCDRSFAKASDASCQSIGAYRQ